MRSPLRNGGLPLTQEFLSQMLVTYSLLEIRRWKIPSGGPLDAVYRARISYLASPDQASRLRTAQKAWLQFRDEDCEFIRSVAPRRSEDESFYDCVLKTTIDRRVELRRSVGD